MESTAFYQREVKDSVSSQNIMDGKLNNRILQLLVDGLIEQL